MSTSSISLGQIKAICGPNSPILLAVDWLLAPSHEVRVEIVHKAIDLATAELVHTRHLKQELGEDALTSEVVSSLKMLGFDAIHDIDIGGHVDIAIRARDSFLWLGEAKIHSTYQWLLDGFDQLTTRYSTGLPGQQSGGVLIYCFTTNATAVMDEWMLRLGAERPKVTIIGGTGLTRFSEHMHEGAGSRCSVRHSIVPMHWKPMK